MATTTSKPIPLTTVYSVPTSCSTRWVEFGSNTIYRDEVHAALGAYGSNCWPPSYSVAKYNYYSPGVCPQSWTIATVTNVASASGQYSAHCCPSGYSFDSLCLSTIPPTTTLAYQTGKTAATKNATTTIFTLSPTYPISYPLPTGGMAKIDGVPIRWASSDVPHLPAAATGQLIIAMSQLAQPTSVGSDSSSEPGTGSGSAAISGSSSSSGAAVTATTTVTASPNSKPGSSLGIGAKAGIGAGVGASGLFLFIGLLLYWFRMRRHSPKKAIAAKQPKNAPKKSPGTPVMELEGDSNYPQELAAKPPVVDWLPGEKGPRVLSGHFYIDNFDEKKGEEEGGPGTTRLSLASTSVAVTSPLTSFSALALVRDVETESTTAPKSATVSPKTAKSEVDVDSEGTV